MKRIPESELIINPDGSVFHLHIKPGELAQKVILVGDPGRVEMIASFFDTIECTAANREFNSVTGTYQGKRMTVLSSGIGTDNIDIVMNELDALVNVDFETRLEKAEKTTLEIVRIGTSGGLHQNIPVDSVVLSERSIGFDGLLNFYEGNDAVTDSGFENYFMDYVGWNPKLTHPYVVESSLHMIQKFDGEAVIKGTTISAPGFYGPQGRIIRLNTVDNQLNDKLALFNYEGKIITNYEMESSAIAGLSKLMGHEAVTLCVIIANRVLKEYSKDYKPVVKKLVQYVLDRL